ncbi:sulfotransferase family 2 domain-containing protein [Nitrospirillum sp. BR 11164]|uniref:sulfotransferase family 2 domain-containing protein n=1 Tax=Nitrospirillum sp. BR 11164 TaxID=3104324 RepID=UPI002AFEB78B|nr:sulfotransferase family 2 domain-containing protein [Nitrospirillum sp. BR 11164]MEA1652013.1 sulfotransferase family 2 domain-containing protein [Nitrospirillum sp. BR 11164]
MPPYDPTAPLISLHIPKTGGSSLREVLAAWFPGDSLLFHYRDRAEPPTRHDLRGGTCIHGHFNGARGIGAWQYYPGVMQHITFLRDPFDRFLSQWFYLNKRKRAGYPEPDLTDDPAFDVWLHRRAEAQAQGNNPYSFIWQMPLPPGAVDLDTLFDRHFVFVGIMERYAASLDALATALGKPPLPPPHSNATERDSDLTHWRPVYEKLFPDEYELYGKACLRNAATIAG